MTYRFVQPQRHHRPRAFPALKPAEERRIHQLRVTTKERRLIDHIREKSIDPATVLHWEGLFESVIRDVGAELHNSQRTGRPEKVGGLGDAPGGQLNMQEAGWHA